MFNHITRFFLLVCALALPGLASAQTAAAPTISPQNMQALGQILSSPAAQSLIATQLGAVGGNAGASAATNVATTSLLSANIGSVATVLQNFTPQEIAAMQQFALSPEGQSIAQKIPAVIQQLQAQGVTPAAGQ